MPRYLVKETSFINGQIVNAGEEVDYDGVASFNLELIGDKKATVAADTASKAALVKEALDLKATIVDSSGNPTDEPITGNEDIEVIQAAIQKAKERRTD